MKDEFASAYPSLLEGYENLDPLPECVPWPPHPERAEMLTRAHILSDKNEDGKSLRNPQHGVLSKAYLEFPDPLTNGQRGGFDIHIYHFQVGGRETTRSISALLTH